MQSPSKKPPLREIVRRDWRSNGVYLVLECGHQVWSYNGKPKHKRAGCADCLTEELRRAVA